MYIMNIFHNSDVYVLFFQYVDRELIRNFLLASAAVFIVVLVIVADLRSSLFVVFCVAFTTVCLKPVHLINHY